MYLPGILHSLATEDVSNVHLIQQCLQPGNVVCPKLYYMPVHLSSEAKPVASCMPDPAS